LIAEGDDALSELLEEFPAAERQHLRQLIRNAKREAERNKPPKSAREIFRYLRQLTE
jgi:ribosome-associated protein